MDIHDPLPYVVRLRMALTDDAVSETREVKVTAYNAAEAVAQAIYEATGSAAVVPDKLTVEFVGPDEDQYWVKAGINFAMRMLLEEKVQEAVKQKKKGPS